MPSRVRLMFSALSLALFLVAAAPLYRELTLRSDIWWTPQVMLVPLGEAKDRVEIQVRGTPLAGLIQAGQLRVAQDGTLGTLQANDVGLRFNNWDRVRVERRPLLLMYAATCGFMACLFLLVVTGRLAYRVEKAP